MKPAAVVEGCFLSALQPNSSRTAYALPSDVPAPDLGAKARRVREQVRMRLAEKKSSSMSRLDDSTGDYPAVKTYTPTLAFSSRSMIHTPSRVMAVRPLPSSGFSSRSAMETNYRMSQSGASMMRGSYQATQSQPRSRRSKSFCQADHEELPLSLLAPPDNPAYMAPSPALGSLRRSLSGTLAQGAGGGWHDEDLSYQHAYRGPSHRTISRITNRQQHYQQQSSAWGQEGWAGPGWGGQWQQHVARTGPVLGAGQYQASLHRAASLRSMRSVGKGVDVGDGASTHSNDQLGGAVYIQLSAYDLTFLCVCVSLQGIPALVHLFSSESQEVQRFATGAVRNLIYENSDNKAALIEAGGVMRLVSILDKPDEELRKNITGILWNLSSRDNLKEKLSREALPELTDKVLIPLCSSIQLSPSEKDIFFNTTGCLRNLSSVNERTRQKMREMRGLVDSLVSYVQSSLQEERAEDKGLENSLCVLRNLSYQLYKELPPSVRHRLEGPSRAAASRESQAIGCFSLYAKNSKQHNQDLSVLSEVSRQPRGPEWLWHPKVVALYKSVLQSSGSSTTSREAAIGALQNITAGDARWSSVLSRVMLEQERMLPILLDLLDSSSDMELKALTGLLRNLARHCSNKDHMAKTMVNVLVSKLPSDGLQKEPSSEVVVNICGALNHLVTSSSLAARDISYFNGLPKLLGIKTSHDSSSGALMASKAASTVLCNMFQYRKLHRDYKLVRSALRDFYQP
uniref:Plakophilin 3b n=1 Tax=Myripristis murdjan TaxID=586833 RepID=A0A667WG67_9TELE